MARSSNRALDEAIVTRLVATQFRELAGRTGIRP
jgi:hypothetical protein